LRAGFALAGRMNLAPVRVENAHVPAINAALAHPISR